MTRGEPKAPSKDGKLRATHACSGGVTVKTPSRACVRAFGSLRVEGALELLAVVRASILPPRQYWVESGASSACSARVRALSPLHLRTNPNNHTTAMRAAKMYASFAPAPRSRARSGRLWPSAPRPDRLRNSGRAFEHDPTALRVFSHFQLVGIKRVEQPLRQQDSRQVRMRSKGRAEESYALRAEVAALA
eukprot:scaffold434_cov186-Pinguiococcus_pyrenoidosus.AAC.135